MYSKAAGGTVRLALMLATLLLSAGCEDQRGVKIGDSPPAIEGRDIHGRSVSLAGLTGKVVALYFWTDSCCADSLKELEPVYGRYKEQGLEVVAINVLDSRDEVESLARKNRLSFTVLRDEESRLFQEYKVRGFPTVFLVDRAGVVREKILGTIRTGKLEKLIQRQIEAEKLAGEAYRKLQGGK